MPIVAVGANHESAALHLREKLAIPAAALPAALAELRELAAEVFILSTCNRSEIYALVDDVRGSVALRGWLLARLGADDAAAIYGYSDADAVRHLFTVAAGLDSLVLGEDQILLQLKAALASATEAVTLGPVLHRLGHNALTAGKQVRSETAISRSNLSVVSAALRLAAAKLGDLRRRDILIVGAGQTAELALKHLSDSRGGSLTVVSRNVERASALAQRHDASARPWSDLAPALAAADLLISCTSAPHAVIDAPLLRERLRPLLVLDLAVPRDVEPVNAPGVRIYDVDSLKAITDENRRLRGGAIAAANEIVAAAAERFMDWWRTRAVAPTVTALRDHVTAVCDAEVDRLLARMPDLSPAEQATVRYLGTAIANKLLHAPVAEIKEPGGAPLARAAQRLFRLPEAAEPVGPVCVGAQPFGPDQVCCMTACPHLTADGACAERSISPV